MSQYVFRVLRNGEEYARDAVELGTVEEARADAGKTKELEASEKRFLKRRDACRSEACQTAAYVGQMRTISKIMAR